MSVFTPSASNFQPWNGHTISQPSTVPPWPRWAPRCGQNGSCTWSTLGVVAPGDEVPVEVVDRLRLTGGEVLGVADAEPAEGHGERARARAAVGHRHASSPNTRTAFSRRNLGHTSSLRPDVGQLGEDALERQPHREVAGVHDLVGAAGVGVVDDRLRVVLRRERRGGVVEVRPLEHQLHGQLVPRLGAVAHHDLELGEEPAHLVEQLGLLAEHRHPRAGHAGGDADRDVELDALRVDRVEALVVDRHLRASCPAGNAVAALMPSVS